MSKRGLLILVALALVLIGVRLMLGLPLKDGSEASGQSAEPLAVASMEPLTPPSSARPSLKTDDEAPELPLRALNEIRSCLGPSGDGIRTLNDFVLKLAPRGQGENFSKWRNLHVTLPSGDRRRIHLFSDSTPDGRPVVRMRLFGEDAEGLPVPLPLAPEDQVNPDESRLKFHMGEGLTEFIEEAWAWRGQAGDGTAQSLEWTEENGQVVEAHFVSGEKSLGCALGDSPDCECRE